MSISLLSLLVEHDGPATVGLNFNLNLITQRLYATSNKGKKLYR